MTEVPEEFVQRQVEELKNRDDVLAVALVGSYARNPDRDQNDLDILVIVDDDWRRRVTEEVEEVVVEKFFNSEDWIEKYIEERIDVGNEKPWYPYHWFSNADVRYDPENLFEDFRKLAEEKKDENLDKDIDQDEFLHYLWDYQQDLDTDDVGQKRYLMYQMFDYILKKNYQLKKEVPVKSNYRIKRLQDFDGYMYKLAQEFLTSSSTMKKERKLEKMVDHVTKGMGEPGPEWETEKEEM